MLYEEYGRVLLCEVQVGHMPSAVGHIEWDSGNNRWWLGVRVFDRWQGKGLGTVIVSDMLELARLNGNKETWITCPEALVEWYERFGFSKTEDATIKKADGQVLMVRREP
jgi:GNAT superfamily N-acetyltransferase